MVSGYVSFYYTWGLVCMYLNTLMIAAVLVSSSSAALSGNPYVLNEKSDQHEAHGGGAFTSLDDEVVHDCITPDERATADFHIANYRRNHPGFRTSTESKLTFYPMGGRLYHDIYTTNFVDLASGSDVLDWNCTAQTYNGHQGNDTGIRTFEEQAIGVPAFAAMDGVVVWTADGNPDMNTDCDGNPPGNAIIIDHGDELFGYYWHFKNGSVLVSAGDTVVAGQQIAQIGSSGCSTSPHLHLEFRDHDWFGGSAIEPYVGQCNAGESMWDEQPDMDRDFYVIDHGITRTEFDSWPASSIFRYPNDRQFLLGDTYQYYWILGRNLPATGTIGWRFIRPDGHVSYSTDAEYDNGSFNRKWVWKYYWNIPDMHQFPGTWTVQFILNDEVTNMYPVIVDELDEEFNRPPVTTGLFFSPEYPLEGDVLECNVNAGLNGDDPDRDIVQYRYAWHVNGALVRDVVSAGMNDALPRDAAVAGDMVTVEVTAGDGELDGTMRSTEVEIGVKGPPVLIVDIGGNGDFLTIQEAVNAADEGNIILIRPGIYTGAGDPSDPVVDMQGKSLMLRGLTSGRSGVVINGDGVRRGIVCDNGETESTVIENINVEDCLSEDGAGMYCTGSPTLRDCTFHGNIANGSGGGIYMDGSSAILENCVFDLNAAEFGGGLFMLDSSPSISGGLMTSNTASSRGGAIRMYRSSPDLSNVEITGNSATRGGGAHIQLNSNPVFQNCQITSNSADSLGGGLATNSNSVASYIGCIFINNQATGDNGGQGSGAAIYSDTSDIMLDNCLISGNVASTYGGGMYCWYSSPTVINTAIASNTSGNFGAGIRTIGGTGPLLDHVIVCGNTPDQMAGPWDGLGENCLAESCSDNNGNNWPDECDLIYCLGDTNQDGSVDVEDLLLVLEGWGTGSGDLNGDGVCGVDDILIVIEWWGQSC